MRAALLAFLLNTAAFATTPLAEAVTTGGSGFGILRGDPLGGWFEEGLGRSRLVVEAGRASEAEVYLSLPAGVVRAELHGAAPAWGLPVHGHTGWGVWGAVPARAAVALAGMGRLWLDGVDAGPVRVQVLALSAGTHADDGSHALLPHARDGDLELEWILETSSGGPLRLFFDEVRIALRGEELPSTPAEAAPGTSPPNVGPASLGSPAELPAPPRAGTAPMAAPLARTPRPANAAVMRPVPPGAGLTAGRGFVSLPSTPAPGPAPTHADFLRAPQSPRVPDTPSPSGARVRGR